jgi:hypothetical protein
MDQGHGQAFGIEHSFVFEHEINGASQFDGDDGIGFELVASHFGFQALSQPPDELVIAAGGACTHSASRGAHGVKGSPCCPVLRRAIL